MNHPTEFKIKGVIALVVCALVLSSLVLVASAQTTMVKAEVSPSQPRIGDTLTVNIKVTNAQNLFGVDITLNWNSSTLKVVSATSQLGVESHPNGVLHESSSYPIEVVNDEASQSTAQYHLLATSTGSTTPTFSGDGTIATVTFNVTNAGPSGLSLSDVELSVLAADRTANLVTPQTSVDTVNVAIPEFPSAAIIIALAVAAATAVVSVKLLKNRVNLPVKKASNI